jgi:hypothetical protein
MTSRIQGDDQWSIESNLDLTCRKQQKKYYLSCFSKCVLENSLQKIVRPMHSRLSGFPSLINFQRKCETNLQNLTSTSNDIKTKRECKCYLVKSREISDVLFNEFFPLPSLLSSFHTCTRMSVPHFLRPRMCRNCAFLILNSQEHF